MTTVTVPVAPGALMGYRSEVWRVVSVFDDRALIETFREHPPYEIAVVPVSHLYAMPADIREPAACPTCKVCDAPVERPDRYWYEMHDPPVPRFYLCNHAT